MPTPTEGPATWEWWQGALGVLVAVMGSGVAVLVFFGITAIFGGDPGDPRGGVKIAGLLLQNVVFVFSVVVAANMNGGPVKPWMLRPARTRSRAGAWRRCGSARSSSR